MKPDFSLILPCYNESSHLEQSIKEILSVLDNVNYRYEIILVDDKSTDNTLQLIKKICQKNQNIKFIFHRRNWGRGRAVETGIHKAKGKVFGFIDVDLEVSPVYIPYLVSKISNGEADIAIGHRIYRTTLSSLPRAVLSRSYSFLVRKMLGVQLKDTETGYKFFNRRKIAPLLEKTKNHRWFWDTEIMTYAYYQKLKIIEIPVLFIRRPDKQSTVNIFKDVPEYLLNLLRFRQRLKTEI